MRRAGVHQIHSCTWLLDEQLNDKTLLPRPTWSYLDDTRRWEQRLLLINHRGHARLRQDEKVSESSKRFHLLLSSFTTFVVQPLVTPPRLHIPYPSHHFVWIFSILLSFIIPFLSSTRSFYFLHFLCHCRICCSFVVSGVLLISLHLNFSSLQIATVTVMPSSLCRECHRRLSSSSSERRESRELGAELGRLRDDGATVAAFPQTPAASRSGIAVVN